MSFKITTNKILFLISSLIDIFFLYKAYDYEIWLYYIFIPILILLLSYFKYFHFCVCYTFINRRNVNNALLSLIICNLYKLAIFFLLYITFNFVSLLLMGIVGSVDMIISAYFFFNIYFMKSLLYFDMNIPVDGFGIDEKVDMLGDAIPGL